MLVATDHLWSAQTGSDRFGPERLHHGVAQIFERHFELSEDPFNDKPFNGVSESHHDQHRRACAPEYLFGQLDHQGVLAMKGGAKSRESKKSQGKEPPGRFDLHVMYLHIRPTAGFTCHICLKDQIIFIDGVFHKDNIFLC